MDPKVTDRLLTSVWTGYKTIVRTSESKKGKRTLSCSCSIAMTSPTWALQAANERIANPSNQEASSSHLNGASATQTRPSSPFHSSDRISDFP